VTGKEDAVLCPLRNIWAFLLLVFLCSFADGQSNGVPAKLPYVAHRQEDPLHPYAVVTTTNYLHSPLLEAILAVNREYGWAISFEDAPTVNTSEIVDTAPDLHRMHPELKGTYAPNDTPFSSTFPEVAPYHANIPDVLQQIVADYNATNNHGKFRVLTLKDGGYTVVGSEYHDKNEVETHFVSPLECVLTVTVEPANIFDAVKVVADAVNTSCGESNLYRLDAGLLSPSMAFGAMQQVSGSYTAVSARGIMTDLLSQLHENAYYSIGFVPVDDFFGISLWGATRNCVDPSGNIMRIPVPNPKMGMQSPKTRQVCPIQSEFSGWSRCTAFVSR
jgi:hypothetical protein